MKKDDLIAGAKLIIKDFQLENDTILEKDLISYDLLHARLVQIIEHLISKDFNRLLNTLYRIDVSEERLKAALATNPEHPAETIATMIIDRELQKVETRKKYS